MNQSDKRAIVETLKLEIGMIRDGRYNRPAEKSGTITRFLRDSATCPNFTLPDECRKAPCTQCLLYRFVPVDHPHREIACHDIPLNDRGDTLAKLEEQDDSEKAEPALLSWLYRTVARLERGTSPRPSLRPLS